LLKLLKYSKHFYRTGFHRSEEEQLAALLPALLPPRLHGSGNFLSNVGSWWITRNNGNHEWHHTQLDVLVLLDGHYPTRAQEVCLVETTVDQHAADSVYLYDNSLCPGGSGRKLRFSEGRCIGGPHSERLHVGAVQRLLHQDILEAEKNTKKCMICHKLLS
jgi:hypothetical protein